MNDTSLPHFSMTGQCLYRTRGYLYLGWPQKHFWTYDGKQNYGKGDLKDDCEWHEKSNGSNSVWK